MDKKRIYNNRDQAIEEVSKYVDTFYKVVRRHRHLGGVSPEDFEASAITTYKLYRKHFFIQEY